MLLLAVIVKISTFSLRVLWLQSIAKYYEVSEVCSLYTYCVFH